MTRYPVPEVNSASAVAARGVRTSMGTTWNPPTVSTCTSQSAHIWSSATWVRTTLDGGMGLRRV